MKSLQRLGIFALSLFVVAALTEVVGKAAITVTTTSSGITPVTNQPVIVLGSNIGTTDYAVSSVTLVHIPTKGMKWVGIEATGGIVHTGGSAVGTHIVWLDSSSKVALQVLSADEFVIHNGATTSQSGSVKLIW